MQDTDIPTSWVRGTLAPCLLALLTDGPAYGYDLSRQLDSHGLGRVRGGSLYPALLQLEEQGLLSATWKASASGPGRKYYALTDAGRTHAERTAERWQTFAQTVSTVLDKALG